MEPLDPELRRIVHDGMVEAVPGADIQRRVLEGLLRRLPSPPEGTGDPEPSGRPPSEPIAPAASGASTASVGGGKIALLAVALGGVAVAVAVGRGEPERPRTDAAPPDAPSVLHRGASSSATDKSMPVPTPHAPERADRPLAPGSPRPDRSRRAGPTDAAASGPAASGPAASGPAAEPSETPPQGRVAPPSPDIDATLGPEALAAETRLIAAAERALTTGHVRRALELTQSHAAEHPDGQLRVERLALELRARCTAMEPGLKSRITLFMSRYGHTPAAARVRARCQNADRSGSGDG